jgi:hypothetical protein
MYMCRLRHINDSVLLSLKMEGIRLLFLFYYSMTVSKESPNSIKIWQFTRGPKYVLLLQATQNRHNKRSL